MKAFVKVLRTIALCCLVGLALTSAAAQAAGSKVAHFHLTGPLTEKPPAGFGFSLGFEPSTLRDVVDNFRQAKDDAQISAILITFGAPQMGLAQIEELRKAIKDVGKPVYLHADDLSTGLYYLSTAAAHLSVTPTGDVWIGGIYAEAPYVKNMLDKIHVEFDFVHIGDYKSAGEMFYLDHPSPPAEANMNWLLDGLFGEMVTAMADTRFKGDKDKARKAIDHGMYTAEEALKAGLIDSVMHRQDLVAKLKSEFGEDLMFVQNYGDEEGPNIDFGNPFSIFKLIGDMMSGKPETAKQSVAIVHVEGPIMTGEEDPNPFGGGGTARSTTIRLGLDAAADDDNVKALVLRVDSPGGSALASEIIYDATQRVKAKGKPVVVSMGNVAGSGGYYVSCGADVIIADATTITASIGVVGGKMVTTGLWDWMGVNWHAYKRGASADIMTTSRKWSDGERERIMGWMNTIYDVFKGHITKHRGSKLTKPIDEMAGGRVFTGEQALKLGLVDQLGTLHDAIAKAAELAAVTDYEVITMPRPKNFFDMLREGMGSQEKDSVRVAAGVPGLFGAGSPLMDGVLPLLQTLDPQRVRVLWQSLRRMEILHQENVILMPAEDFILRW